MDAFLFNSNTDLEIGEGLRAELEFRRSGLVSAISGLQLDLFAIYRSP